MNSPKRTVGLMTLSNVINFGSALQTYATIKTVEKAGFDCTLIDYAYPSAWHINNAPGGENYTSGNKLKSFIKTVLYKIGLLNMACLLWMLLHRRKKVVVERIFREFLEKLPITEKMYDRKSILKIPPEFDIYMTGSDQTWNPRYMHTDYSFLLNFAPDKAPKISYAASFGATEILPAYTEVYKRYLMRYDRISVRESTGVPLVKNLTGQNAVHVPDPTLMLNGCEWNKINKNKLNLPEKYIFAYILNYVFNPYPKVCDLLDHLSQISGLPVVFYGSTPRENYLNVDDSMGPEGFVECFANASFVVTTSFHGSAFSVNFEKDFLAVLNHTSSKDDRVKSFLRTVGLENRGIILPETDILSITAADMNTDHTRSREILNEMREKTFEYLKEALEFSCRKCEQGECNG